MRLLIFILWVHPLWLAIKSKWSVKFGLFTGDLSLGSWVKERNHTVWSCSGVVAVWRCFMFHVIMPVWSALWRLDVSTVVWCHTHWSWCGGLVSSIHYISWILFTYAVRAAYELSTFFYISINNNYAAADVSTFNCEFFLTLSPVNSFERGYLPHILLTFISMVAILSAVTQVAVA